MNKIEMTKWKKKKKKKKKTYTGAKPASQKKKKKKKNQISQNCSKFHIFTIIVILKV